MTFFKDAFKVITKRFLLIRDMYTYRCTHIDLNIFLHVYFYIEMYTYRFENLNVNIDHGKI